jgi:hypothetical protein
MRRGCTEDPTMQRMIRLIANGWAEGTVETQ